MTGSFLATWIRLRRPAMLGGTYAAVAAAAALFTTLIVVNAGSADARGPGEGVTLAMLSAADGLVAPFAMSVNFIGVIAVAVAAATFAGEYTSGTIRSLLIRQPHRLRLLFGTLAAVVTFALGSVLAGAVTGAVTSAALAGGQGVDTSLWYTADGWAAAAGTLGRMALAVAGFAIIGSVLGVLLRAPVAAVAIGVAWLLPLENILAGSVDGSARWLPGQLLEAISRGGTDDVTAAAATVTAAAFLAVALAATAATFARRDVTA
jgi:ABC-2 type transport system permease protein